MAKAQNNPELKKTLITERDSLHARIAFIAKTHRRLMAKYNAINELLKTYDEDLEAEPLSFANMSIGQAIRAFLGANPESYFSPNEIKKALLDGGFQTHSDNLGIMVRNYCQRRIELNDPVFERSERNGVGVFRIKEGARLIS